MKKYIAFTLLFLLLFSFPSCNKEKGPSTFSCEEAATAIRHAVGEDADFTRADQDYMESNFGTPLKRDGACIYFADAERGCAEFGVFLLENEGKASAFLNELRAYLAREIESREALMALYPEESLAREIDQFKNATVAKNGSLVYYFAMEARQAESAGRALASLLE